MSLTPCGHSLGLQYAPEAWPSNLMKVDMFGISFAPTPSRRKILICFMLCLTSGSFCSLEQPESISSSRSFSLLRLLGIHSSDLQFFMFSKTSFWRFSIVGGSLMIAVPSKCRNSILLEITWNSLRFEQSLRIRILRDTKFIFGRDQRRMHPRKFRKTRDFIFWISAGNSSKTVQPSKFNLWRFSAFDNADKLRNLLEWRISTHLSRGVSCDNPSEFNSQ